MPFNLPTFNLAVNLWRPDHTPGTDPVDLTFMGNLNLGLRAYVQVDPETILDGTSLYPAQFLMVYLLCPALTDIRGPGGNLAFPLLGDYVQVGHALPTLYRTMMVEDVAKGFANEHRLAVLYRQTTVWPLD